jgi:hypothetical protein
MAQRRSKATKRRSAKTVRSSSRAVTRREYAELVVRLGSVELQTQRTRAELELHARRIAQLHDLVEALRLAGAASALSSEMAVLPAPPKGTIES